MQRPSAPGSLCLVPAQASGPEPRYLCYCEGPARPGRDADLGGTPTFNLYVTDALELWSTSFTPESLQKHRAQHDPDGAEDYWAWFRVACDQHAVSLALKEDSSASLTISKEEKTLTFDLSKVPHCEAAPRLQALMLGLAEQARGLERQLADPDFRRGAQGPATRKWMPGESLINPGFKSKKPASGVNFDDA
ncbi:protein PAXX isoform X2 [Sminthopsis crassicaudata]|uniref:protein PAXX isoform X2 n=1 Tax=Sminthopsis crassicaudata TaxID=9301 RepID=UPI003D6932C2